jgi:RNA-directed DNA polymerase
MKELLTKTDEWYRRRLRTVIWKQWKRIRAKYINLIKLGINTRLENMQIPEKSIGG